MATKAKLYIAIIAALAAAILAVVATRWNPESFSRFVLFFALAMVGSAMKIRLPGFRTTISTNFVFILAGIALFELSPSDDGPGSLCVCGTEHGARFAGHFSS